MHISVKDNLKRDKSARAGLAIIAVLILFSMITPFFSGNPEAFSRSIFLRPGLNNILGTNDLGQDIFSRLAHGLRTSLMVSIGVGVIATSISLLMGVSSGFIGGIYDIIVMRIIDAFLVMPSIIILILLSVFIRPATVTMIILISLLCWPEGARIIRGQTLALKEKRHIYSARTFGAKKTYILFRHIIPDLGNIIVVSFIHNARTAVFLEAGMAFIGISSITTISLGTIMHNAFKFYYLPVWLWWFLPPGILLSMILLSFTFLGNLMEKLIDPRLNNA
ncbi:MAG: ABC transporter permease [Actinobacteria bacterium]|nr:ABC transporter permease [Actinomycetota bacterium]